MNKKMYLRGMAAQYFYNSTELLALLLTYRPIPKDIEHNKKIKYGPEKNNYYITMTRKDLKEEKKPLLIYIHGGGWISGLISMRNTYIVNWAKQGFFTASLNYSYAPQEIFPTQLKELFSAIDTLLDSAEKDNFDCENVLIAGESAGGYFISYIISCLNNPHILEKLGIEFRHLGKIKIKAMVSHCGCYNIESLTDPEKKQSKFPDIKVMTASFIGKPMKELREYAKTEEGKLLSPVFDEKFPPSFITWCTRDYLKHEAFDIIDKFKEMDIPHKTFKGDGIIGNHAWTIVTMFKKAKECLNESYDFVLPFFDDYFEEKQGKWIFKKK